MTLRRVEGLLYLSELSQRTVTILDDFDQVVFLFRTSLRINYNEQSVYT